MCHLTGQVGKAPLPPRGAKGARERNQYPGLLKAENRGQNKVFHIHDH